MDKKMSAQMAAMKKMKGKKIAKAAGKGAVMGLKPQGKPVPEMYSSKK